MATDILARDAADINRARIAALAALPRFIDDGSIVALGDSITANSLSVRRVASGSDSWQAKGPFAMLVARSGGRLQPVQIDGWPYTGANSGGVEQVLIANGGSGYSPATTLSFDAASGGTGAAATPIIVDGRIAGVTVTNKGANYSQSPFVTVSDSGGGSGAVLLAQLNGTGQYAVGAISSVEAEAYLPLVLNGGNPVARNCIVAIGTNNASRAGGAPIGLADSKASILRICRALVAGGVRPFVVAVLPRNGTAGANPKKQADALRRWQLEQLSTLAPGTIVLDAGPWLIDNSLGSEIVPTTLLPDGLHPNIAGADRIAKALWAQMAPYFGAGQAMLGSYGDAYDAIYNPQGSLISSTGMSLMGSGSDSAPAGGEAPWTGVRSPTLFLSRKSGGTGAGTIAASRPNRSDGRLGKMQRLQIAVTGAVAGETYRLSWGNGGSTPPLAVGGANALQVGDRIKAGIDEAIFSNIAGLRGVKLRLYAQSSGGAITPTAADPVSGALQQAAWGDYEETAGYPAWSGDALRLETREMVIPASAAFVSLVFELVFDAGTVSCTVDLSGAWVRKLN
jgi:lysophospholipase L1-like esterase